MSSMVNQGPTTLTYEKTSSKTAGLKRRNNYLWLVLQASKPSVIIGWRTILAQEGRLRFPIAVVTGHAVSRWT